MTEKPWTVVFRLPELFEAIAQYLDKKTLHRLRLVSKALHELSVPFFSITLVIGTERRNRDFKIMIDAVLREKGRMNPLDQIQSLQILHDRNHAFSNLDPKGSVLLNQLRNLRHVMVQDDNGRNHTPYPPDKSFYPAMLIWPRVCSCDSHSPKSKSGQWSRWDLLPLEGSMLCRLESLKVTAGAITPFNLDRFFSRLGRSGVSKTLRSLAVVGSRRSLRAVSWKVFRGLFQDGANSLQELETLEIEGLKINGLPGSNLIQGQAQHQRVPSKIKNLTFDYQHNNTEFKLAIMDLFPNVETLILDSMQSLLELPRDVPIERLSLLFPRLATLYLRIRSAFDWDLPNLLRRWIQSHPGLHLAYLDLHEESIQQGKDLVAFLCENFVTLRHLEIFSENKSLVLQLLWSIPCSNLEVLEVRTSKIDGNDIAALALDYDFFPERPAPPIFRRASTPRLSWTKTLTRLSLVKVFATPDFRHLLQSLPCLIDLEIRQPLMSLDLFDGLGRQEQASVLSDGGDLDQLLPSSFWTDYGMTERPALERLKLQRSYQSYKFDLRDRSAIEEWKKALFFKFRFLSDLTMIYQAHPARFHESEQGNRHYSEDIVVSVAI